MSFLWGSKDEGKQEGKKVPSSWDEKHPELTKVSEWVYFFLLWLILTYM
jgi:hypothetical protein